MVVPPDTTGEEFNLNWEEIGAAVNDFPAEYALTMRGGGDDDEDDLDTPLLPMVCHKVKVQR